MRIGVGPLFFSQRRAPLPSVALSSSSHALGSQSTLFGGGMASGSAAAAAAARRRDT